MSQHNQVGRQSRSLRPCQAVPGADPPVDAPSNPLRILLLEDDADTCEALEALLCPEDGFELQSAGDIRACLERLRCASAAVRPYDVLLLDLVLSGGHWGTEVIEAAQLDPVISLPAVVVCTALSGTYLEAQLPTLDACGAHIVPKPFDVDDLVHVLRHAAAGRKRR